MVKMVHDRIAAGQTTVVSTAAVLRYGKQMENLHIITFPGQSLSKTLEEAMDLSQDRLILELETCIREVFGSNLGRDTDYPRGFLVFPESLQENAGIITRICYESFLPIAVHQSCFDHYMVILRWINMFYILLHELIHCNLCSHYS
jgi:hypothetical protein